MIRFLKRWGKPQKEPTTHDYTEREWGHDFGIMKVIDGGKKLKAYGWGLGIERGDYLILVNGQHSSRYQAEAIKYEFNPPDMWWATLVFAPRPTSEAK